MIIRLDFRMYAALMDKVTCAKMQLRLRSFLKQGTYCQIYKVNYYTLTYYIEIHCNNLTGWPH